MKVRRIGLLAAVAMFAAVPVTADAGSARDRVTGGGQVILDPNNPPQRGALDTVAYTAQRTTGGELDTDAKGQVQVNRRSGAEGTQVKFHGVVECMHVIGNGDGGEAFVSGTSSKTGEPFELYVYDAGKNVESGETDIAMVWYAAETGDNDADNVFGGPQPGPPPPEEEYCGIEEDVEEQLPPVVRGQAKVYDASFGSQASSQSASTKSSRSTSLTSSLALR